MKSCFILFIAASQLALAQPESRTAPCSQEEMMTIKGKWVKNPEDHIITGQEHAFSDGDFLSRLLMGRPQPDAHTH